MTNYTQSVSEVYFGENTFESKFAGIVYTGSAVSEDNKLYYQNFLILDQSGNLYKLQLSSHLENSAVKPNSGRTLVKVGKLNIAPKNGASITRVSGNRAYISVNTATGAVELYSLNLTTYAIKALGGLGGVQSLVGLYSDGELTGVYKDNDAPIDPDAPVCDHTNVGQWESDDTNHWKICECGERVEQGEHSAEGEWETDESSHWKFCKCGEKLEQSAHSAEGDWESNGTNHWKTCKCGAKVAQSVHDTDGAWETDESSHWKTCKCGVKVAKGEHSYKDGKCVCGKDDPNAQPDGPALPEVPEGSLRGKWLHGYIKTVNGYSWAAINAETGEYIVLANGTTEYYGGGTSDGMIYVSALGVGEYGMEAPQMITVDPTNGYAATNGFVDDYNFKVREGLRQNAVEQCADIFFRVVHWNND